jgi:hypothetical protein
MQLPRCFPRVSWAVGVLVLILLAACASATTASQPTSTTVAQAQPTATATSTPVPTCKANNIPTGGSVTEPVIPPSGWTTFSDTLLHYTINYPSNWIVPNGPCPGASFVIYNHIPIPASGAPALPRGGFYIDVYPMPNPSQVSATDFAEVARLNMPDGPPCGAAYTLSQLQVAGRDAVLATCPAGSAEGAGDPNQGYNYFVPDGTTMLAIIQRDLVNGKSSSVLQQMLESIVFTS